MSNADWDNMSEDEQTTYQKRDNNRLRRQSRNIREAMLEKITKDKDSEEFPNIDGSNKQVYAIATILDGMDRDVQESEKAMAAKEVAGDTGALVTSIFEGIVERMGDPSAKFASGNRGERTVGDERTRLRPEIKATNQHMHIGKDEIDYNDVFHKDKKEKK